MAAKNEALGYQITIGVLVTLLLILTVVFIMTFKEQQKYIAEAAQAKKSDTDAKTALNTELDNTKTLKGLVGYDFSRIVDTQDTKNENTVVGAATADRLRVGAELAGSNMSGTIKNMRTALTTTEGERQQSKDQSDKLQKEILALREEYQRQVDTHQKDKQKAEADLRNVQQTRDEQLAAKQQEITDLRKTVNDTQVELQEEKEARDRERRALQDEIGKLETVNARLFDQLNNLRQVSFEIPDGHIVKVDAISRTVWISLGKDDFLRERTRFSVYTKINQGVGRGQEDIKGSIEVTKIIGPHLAEASIQFEQTERPFAPGDLIYTPLWSPGRPEKFAFIGKIDLDGDGRSDRDLLRQILDEVGAKIVTEVDDDQNRTGETLSESTKFLVLGIAPNPGDALGDEEQARVQRYQDYMKELDKEARLYAVRKVSLNDFMAYIGYTPRRRVFIPGESKQFTLKSGSGLGTLSETTRDKSSSGITSGATRRNADKNKSYP